MSTRTDARVADAADAATVTDIFTLAFHQDPVWSWAFPDEARRAGQHAALWRFYVDRALVHNWVWLTADHGAAASWIPPGCPEIPEEDEGLLERMLVDLVGDRQAKLILEAFECFEEAHPAGTPHYYLSLLGTHPDHRGHGLGMALVADNLDLIDAAGAPAYLESSNPANKERYERVRADRRLQAARRRTRGGHDVARSTSMSDARR